MDQAYVSAELTHFVGRGEPAEDQYRILQKGFCLAIRC